MSAIVTKMKKISDRGQKYKNSHPTLQITSKFSIFLEQENPNVFHFEKFWIFNCPNHRLALTAHYSSPIKDPKFAKIYSEKLANF